MHRCLIRRSVLILIICASGTPLLWSSEPANEAAAVTTENTAAAETEPAKYELAYTFTPGQVVHLKSDFQARMEVRFKDAPAQTDKNKSTLWKHYTVTAATEDGTGTLELQLDKAHQEAQFGDNPPEVFKSDDPEFHHRKFRDTLAKIGHPTALIDYSPQGKLLKVVEPNGQNKVADQKRPPQDHQGFLIPLPAAPVVIGDTWKDTFQQEVGIQGGLNRKIDMMRVYELKSVKGDLAEIGFKTAILTPVQNEEILTQLSQRLTQGTITFDMRQGMIVAKQITVNETVINAFGAGTLMRVATKLTESVVPADVVADNEPPSAAKKN